jgi:hypothetical protein
MIICKLRAKKGFITLVSQISFCLANFGVIDICKLKTYMVCQRFLTTMKKIGKKGLDCAIFFLSNKKSTEERKGRMRQKLLFLIHVLGYKLERKGLECDKMFTSWVFRVTFGVEKNAENFHFSSQNIEFDWNFCWTSLQSPSLMFVGETIVSQGENFPDPRNAILPLKFEVF